MSLLSSTLNIKPKRKSSKVGVASETSAGNKSLKSASRNVIKSKIDEVECNKEEEASALKIRLDPRILSVNEKGSDSKDAD